MTSKILVIEDNDDNMKLITWILEDAEYDFVGVRSAEEGIERLNQETFDLLLLDISLPGMDGKEACRCIRADDKFESLPIIAVSAHAVKGEKEQILESGVTRLVTKPIDEHHLLVVLEEELAA